MKGLILAVVAGVMAGVGGVWGVDFPGVEAWHISFDATALSLGPTWVEGDESASILVGTGNHAVIIQNGDVVWQSEDLGGLVTAITRVDFGIGDGPEIIVGVKTDTTGDVVVFRGENPEQVSRETLFGIDTIRENPDDTLYRFDDQTMITCFSILPDRLPDQSKRVAIFTLIQIRYNYGEEWYGWSGRIDEYSIADDELGESSEIGLVRECYTEDWSGEGDYDYIFGSITGSSAWPPSTDESPLVRSLNTDFSESQWYAFPDYSYPGYGTPGESPLSIIKQDDQIVVYSAYVIWDDRYEPITYIIKFDSSRFEPVEMARFPLGHIKVIEPYSQHPGEPVSAMLYFTPWGDIAISPIGNEANVTVYSRFYGNIVDAKFEDFDGDGETDLLILTGQYLALYHIGSLSVPPPSSPIPSPLSLSSFPNPFNSSTTISYDVTHPGFVRLGVYDSSGRLVGTVREGWSPPGRFAIRWNAGDLANGKYFIRLNGNGESLTAPVTLIK